MREILFRGKRLQGRDWIEGYFYKSDLNKRMRESGKATLIITPDCDTFIYVPEAHNSLMVIPETVGQYTGLTDKNGKRIFEGDIVKGDSEYFAVDHPKGHIVYDRGQFLMTFDEKLVDIEVLGAWNDDVEVVGNIYDNPELLEGGV